MSKEYEVELPGKLIIEVDEDTGEETERVESLAPEDGGGHQGVLEGFKRRPYIPRRPEGITFYDLGTRRNEGGTYRDIIPAMLTLPLPGFDFWAYYHTLLLQDGYRTRAGCLKMPQGAQYLYFDAHLMPDDEAVDDELDIIGKKNTRPYVKLLGTPLAPLADKTKWADGRLPFKPRNETVWHLYLESAFYYNAFTTKPYGVEGLPLFYKITSTIDPNGDAVEFELKGKERVYLTPIITSHSTGTTPNHVYLSRRLPVLPNLGGAHAPLTLLGYDAPSNELRARASLELWAAIGAYYAPLYPPGVWTDSRASIPVGGSFTDITIDNLVQTVGIVTGGGGEVLGRNGTLGYDLIAHPRTLVAVIIRGEESFYVWQNSVFSEPFYHLGVPGDIFPTGRYFWTRSRIYHP